MLQWEEEKRSEKRVRRHKPAQFPPATQFYNTKTQVYHPIFQAPTPILRYILYCPKTSLYHPHLKHCPKNTFVTPSKTFLHYPLRYIQFSLFYFILKIIPIIQKQILDQKRYLVSIAISQLCGLQACSFNSLQV